MVDVGAKAITQRTAVTEGYIEMHPETLQMILAGVHKKGDVLAIARIAGIMASKKTADLIPLCHPLPITYIEINFATEAEKNRVRCQTTIKPMVRQVWRLKRCVPLKLPCSLYTTCVRPWTGVWSFSQCNYWKKRGANLDTGSAMNDYLDA